MLKRLLTFLFLLFLSAHIFAQKDSLKLSNGDILLGKVKGMSQSVLTFKTKYSDSDFKIKWLEVEEFYSPRTFIILVKDGKRIFTKINTNKYNKNQVTFNGKKVDTLAKLSDIIFIDRFDKNFFSRLHASVDFGLTLRKAQNYQEVSGNLDLSYATQKWKYSTTFNSVFSKQDSTKNITRNEIDLSTIRYLPNDWFSGLTVDLLSNSDQNLKLRATTSLMGGYYFKNTNRMVLGTAAGLAFNNESYFDSPTEGKNSLETFLKVQFNKYDIGNKFSAKASMTASPSITEKGRFRLDSNFYLKYKITSDLYLKANLTHNFDNQPAAGATKGDYVFTTSFGWDNN